jgi:hypothetical protein
MCVLEVIYYLSGPVIAIAAIWGLSQIKISSEQTEELRKTRIQEAERASHSLAAQRCEYFLQKILPQQNKLNEKIKVKNLTFFIKSEIEHSEGKITLKPYVENYAIDKLDPFLHDFVNLFYALENFSVYFNHGLAEETIAFDSVGVSFIEIVDDFMPLFIVMAGNEYFKNTRNLYLKWKERSEMRSGFKFKSRLEERIRNPKVLEIQK